MLEKPRLSFQAQREALAQAAGASANSPIDNNFGKAMEAASGLLGQVQNMDRSGGRGSGGIDPDVVNKLLDSKWASENQEMLNQNGITGPGAGGMSYTPPQGTDNPEGYIYQGLLKRGFDNDTAAAMIMNMKDESGLNAGITEGAPNVHGTRGQGLYQLTDVAEGKGRRTDYLNFLKQNGRNDPWSIDSQLDFLQWETQNTEKNSWAKVMGAQGAGAKGAAIARYFLRPAKEHLLAREKKYLGMT